VFKNDWRDTLPGLGDAVRRMNAAMNINDMARASHKDQKGWERYLSKSGDADEARSQARIFVDVAQLVQPVDQKMNKLFVDVFNDMSDRYERGLKVEQDLNGGGFHLREEVKGLRQMAMDKLGLGKDIEHKPAYQPSLTPRPPTLN